MKTYKLFFPLMVIALLSLSLFAFSPIGQESEIPGLTLEQIGALGVGISILGFVLQMLYSAAAKAKLKLPSEVMQVAVYLFSVLFAFGVNPTSIPVFPTYVDIPNFVYDLLTWLSLLISAVSPVFILAHLIYKYGLKRVRDNVGTTNGWAGFEK